MLKYETNPRNQCLHETSTGHHGHKYKRCAPLLDVRQGTAAKHGSVRADTSDHCGSKTNVAADTNVQCGSQHIKRINAHLLHIPDGI